MAERIVTRTVYGAAIQTVKQLGLKHVVLDYTTINQAINEQTIVSKLPAVRTRGMEITDPYAYQTDTDKIYTNWMVIGNLGHLNFVDPDDAIPYSIPVPHKASDSGLYNIYPFVMRPIAQDLTRQERRIYGLRRTLEVDGELYAAYYGRRLTFDGTAPDMLITTVVDGEETSEIFIPTFENLRPEKMSEAVTYDGVYMSVSMLSTVVFGESEIQNLKDVARLLFGNERKAIISEIGICSAVEKMVKQRYPHPVGSAQQPVNVPADQFYDIVACQINAHVTTYIPISFVDKEYTYVVDLGASEPIFGRRIAERKTTG